jgi:hypothetical protein
MKDQHAAYVDRLVDALAKPGDDRERLASEIRQSSKREREAVEAVGGVGFGSLAADSVFVLAGRIFTVQPAGRATTEGGPPRGYAYGKGTIVLPFDSVEAAEEFLRIE